MKNKLLMLAMLAFFALTAMQVLAQTYEYGFVSSTGTYTPITGGVSLGTETTDDQRFVDPATPAGGTTNTGPGFDIGFSFMFNGESFDRLAINANGWISLGQSTLTPSVNITSSSSYAPISSTSVITPPILYNRVAGFARDLQAQTGASIRLETVGTAPNRVCVIQWQNYKKYGTSGTGDNFNFQIRLYETTNQVQIVYGAITANATAGNMQVGLRGPDATDFNARTGSSGWDNTTAAIASNEYVVLTDVYFPANGLTFTFNYPVADQPPNPANLISPADGATLVTPFSTLNWMSGGGLPEGYKISFGTDNPPTNIVNNLDLGPASTYDPNPDMNPSTTYYWKVVPYNDEGDATNCPIWSFTTHGDATVDELPYSQHFDAVTAPDLPFDWTNIVQSTSTSAVVATYSSTTYAHSAPNSVRLYNPSDADATLLLIGPEIGDPLDVSTIRVKFWARSSGANYPLSIGVISNPLDATTYTELHNIALTTTVSEYIVNLTSYTGTGDRIAFKHGLGGTSRSIYLDDISFEQIAPNDLGCESISGNSTPSVNNATIYSVGVMNWGTATQSTYSVKLFDSEDVELATVAGPTIQPNELLQVPVTWTPTVQGPETIYAKVVLAGDINPDNDTSPTFNVSVQPAGAHVVTIGEGNEMQGIPLEFYYKNSIFQCLYYETELNIFGSITALKFYNNFTTDLSNMPAKFWLGQTNLQDLSAGWIPATELTLVYDGTLNFPSGANEIVVPLQTPFTYTGGNLVLYANRPMDTQYYSSSDDFLAQTIGTNRARKLQSDSTEYDPLNPSAAGTLSGTFPKASFTVVTDGMGSLSGVVTSGGTPLEGVLIELTDVVQTATTGADGSYNFPFLMPGTYTATATKLGYETQSSPITILANEDHTLNFNMPASANVTVSGTVVGSDQPAVGLADAEVYLFGPLDYNTTTNALGQFSIPGVLSGNTYNYQIIKLGYQDLTGSINVGATNYSMGTVTMNEIALPPVQVLAEENEAQTQVALTWRPPGATGGGGVMDFEFDDGGWEASSNWTDPLGDWEWSDSYDVSTFNYTYTGTNVVAPPTAYSGTGMWGTKMHTNYTNSGGFSYLTKTMSFAGYTNTQLRFWSWENLFGDWDYAQVSINGTLVWGPSWDYQGTQWQERIIDLSAYDGMNEVEVQFQMYATSTVNYAGWYIDDVYIGSALTMVRTSPPSVIPAGFAGLSEAKAAQLADSLVPSRTAQALARNSRPTQDQRVLNGYKVWRLLYGNEDNEATWTPLTPAAITDTTYTDTAWASMPDGVYRWAVKGVYTNNVMSDPSFSNAIRILRLDLSATELMGTSTPTVGMQATYQIEVENTGTTTQAGTAYTVKLMSGTTELVSVPGVTLAPGESHVFTLNWIPTTAGPTTLHGLAALPGDAEPDNDATPLMNITVMPAGVVAVTVGDGSALDGRPLDFYYKNSIFETLYYPSEMQMFGEITAISFYNNFTTNLPDKPTKIWLGETQAQDLSGGWILPADLTLVYDGNITYPSGENTITIPLQTPFEYTSGNLVLYANRPWEDTNYSTSDDFKVQTVGSNRARILRSSTTQYDPMAPSAAGTASGMFPMTTFHFAAIGDDPLFAITPSQKDFGTVLIDNDYNQEFVISNAGGGSLTVSTITLEGNEFYTLQALPTLPATINFGQELTFTLVYSPEAEGVHAATITLTDNMTRLTHTVNITANAIDTTIHNLPYAQSFDQPTPPDLPPDWTNIVQSTSTSAFVGTYASTTYSHSAPNCARLYNPSDADATLLLVAPPYDTDIATNTTRVKFWARSSGANYPLSIGVLTNPMDATTYTEVQNISLTTTVTEYVVTFAGYTGAGRTIAFKHGLGGTSRSLYIDDVMLELIPTDDLAVISLTGNSTPTAGSAALYTASVFNWGSNAQDDYEVKLFTTGDVEVASVLGTAVNPGQAVNVSIPWTPAAEGATTLYAKVFLDGDQNPLNDASPIMNVAVQPPGTWILQIGDGSQTARVPVDMYYKNSLFQTIFYETEINSVMFNGIINSVSFHNQFNTDLTNMPTKIWLGSTTLQDLSAGWVPATELTLVFDGTMNYPSGENVITFPFIEPYLYLGGNLIMMVNRPMDTQYYSSSDVFKTQTDTVNRSREMHSDSTTYDPNNPSGGTNNGVFPKTMFHVLPGGVGHLNGVVYGPGAAPLAGVSVTSDIGGYTTLTNAQGEYSFVNVLEDDYQFTFSKHGYISQTHPVEIVEDETEVLDVTMALMPTVTVSGTVLGSDTGAGLDGATVYLTGYEDYNANTTATGTFSFPAVYANQTYDYRIVRPGYMSGLGTITVGATNYNMGNVTITEVAFPPTDVVATANTTNTEVDVAWEVPDPANLNITEGFETGAFPPLEWDQVITNTAPANANGVFPTWCRFGTVTIGTSTVAPPEGNWQSGLWWAYEHQDEWLMTPVFSVPPEAYLSFDTYCFLGSAAGDHYYVKVSLDNGTTWDILWDASAQTGGWNYYTTPIVLDLAAYAGQQIMLAWHAEDPPSNDGLWYTWFIDDIYIGNATTSIRFASSDLQSRSLANHSFGTLGQTLPSRAMQNGMSRSEPVLPTPLAENATSTRSLIGYKVWRLMAGQEGDPDSWISLTDETITEPDYTDEDWDGLANGTYRWAVRAVYTSDVLSNPALSNNLLKETLTGMISGVVRQTNNLPIPGATVTAGTHTATTNNSGAYVLIVPTGVYSVTASAQDFDSVTHENITVNHNQTTTVNFILPSGSDGEENVIPVTETVLKGNYPNPFNPSTTIAYDLKDNDHVRIDIFNYRGQLVKTLVNETKASGRYQAQWNGMDSTGNPVGSGIYYYKMISGSYSSTRKMILMK